MAVGAAGVNGSAAQGGSNAQQQQQSGKGTATDIGEVLRGKGGKFGVEELGIGHGQKSDEKAPKKEAKALSKDQARQVDKDSSDRTENSSNDDKKQADPFAEIEALFKEKGDENADEEQQASEDDHEGSDEESENRTDKNKENKKYRNLRQRAQKSEQALEQMRSEQGQREQQWQEWERGARSEFAKMREQLVRLHTTQEFQKQNQPRVDPNDPAQRLSQELGLPDLEARQSKALQEALGPLQNELKQLKAERARDRQETQNRETRQKYAQEARHIAQNVMLKGMPEAVVKELGGPLSTLLLAGATAFKGDMNAAARALEGINTRWFLARTRAKMSANKGKLEANGNESSANANQLNRRSAPSARGKGVPSQDQATKAGFKDSLDAMLHGGH